MKPLYFPFTYTCGDMINLINQYLGSFIIYQPVAGHEPGPVEQAASAGKIDVRVPVKGDEEKIMEAVARSKNWGLVHQGHMDAFKAMSGQEFYNETFVAEIRTEIAGQKSPQPEAEPMLMARLFLYLAQEFDMKQTELDTDLKASELNREKMLSELRGDTDSRRPTDEHHVFEDLGEYQTANRILSWLRLSAAEKETAPVFITTSRAVFEHLLEFVPGSDVVQIFDAVPADPTFQAAFQNYSAELIKASHPADVVPPSLASFMPAEAAMMLTVAVLPVKSPADLLDRLLSENSDTSASSASNGHMVVSLLEATSPAAALNRA